MSYQVGELENYKPDDPVFEKQENAIQYVFENCDELTHTPYGVWASQEEGSELLVIIWHGEIFSK